MPRLDSSLLTNDDVAALLAVPRSSVYKYARRLTDPLPSIVIRRRRRFERFRRPKTTLDRAYG